MSDETPKPSPELRLLKGTADQPPQSQIRRQQVVNTIREVFEIYGFNPLETPILAHFDQLALKYEEGDPILEEIFRVTDRGKRELGLRYDLTVPFCRHVGMALKGQFPLPFKRYEIGRVFRDGPIKEGRVREFLQCDADVVGSADAVYDAECLAIAGEVFQRLGIDAEIELNNRKILWAILQEAGLDESKRDAATTVVDKWDKVGDKAVGAELQRLGLTPEAITRIFHLLDVGDGGEGTLTALEAEIDSDLLREGMAELRAVMETVAQFEIAIPIRIAPRLARGLGIYTGIIYEFFCRDRSIIGSSIGAGGRYDRVVGEFLHPNDPERHTDYPCVGISFGIEPIGVALDKLTEDGAGAKTVIEVLVIPFDARDEALKLAAALRRQGIKTEVELTGAKLKKVFKRTNANGIPYLALLGEDELAGGEVSLRDMVSGEQVRVPLERLAVEIALRRADAQ